MREETMFGSEVLEKLEERLKSEEWRFQKTKKSKI